ncbi:MAG: hypothetical protein GVY29_05475 [Spirochaetes bacterium]|nr:hypothetical protein [Spirochaetota bacterium]
MRSEALEIARQYDDPGERLNVLREYVQVQILRSFHEAGVFTCLSFVGGTALRFVYAVPRFSVDLDFSVEVASQYEPRGWLQKLDRTLRLGGYEATVTWNDRGVVHSGWVRLAGLLQALDLASHPNQKLAVKLEMDSRPPAGATMARTVVTRHALLALQHHDLPSLMAGKIHAAVTRTAVKGRDWYDLVWYLSRVPPVRPNEVLLTEALGQTRQDLAQEDWRALLAAQVESLDIPTVQTDVRPFLEHPEESEWITREHLQGLLGRAREG